MWFGYGVVERVLWRQVEGCAANVVTFNTLVDVYGKLGRWQDAIRVISQVYMRGLKPDVRTFNTAIIAANMCNQPLEALKV
jgi:pentatricopeptide repeat domain-containing protein 1